MSIWITCCRDRRRNCPTIAVEGDFLYIRDDFESVIRIPIESAGDLLRTINEELAIKEPERYKKLGLDDLLI